MKYLIKNHRLIIDDPELGIFFDLPFSIGKEDSSEHIIEKKTLYPSDTLQSCSYYLNNMLHGPSIHYFATGFIAAKSWYVYGKKQGKSYLFYPSQRIYALQRYKENLLHGAQKYFYENGDIKSHITYENNLLCNCMRLYWEGEILKRETFFSQGKRHGEDTVWNKKKQIVFSGSFIRGNPIKEHKSYDENGILREHIAYGEEGILDKKSYDHLGNLCQVP